MNQSLDDGRLIRSKRKTPLFDKGALSVELDYRRKDIEKIIPHRPPLLFVDRIIGLNRERGIIMGERFLDPNDPVFEGHFPGNPVYPGNFTLEMIGQMGLCMYYFKMAERDDIGPDASPIPVRATRIAGAYYLEPIYPGTTVTLLAEELSSDGYFASMIGQALVNGKVAAVTIGEVLIL